jgi:8-oxo-dGTP pyrophosphatase MutT (NUDIX family)
VSVKPPVVPAPAATLVLLREGGAGVETLLIQRHAGSRFAAGDFVFPGGKVEPDDGSAEAYAWCTGIDETFASTLLGVPDALGYWVGAIREAFEEVGVLLAYGADGAFVEARGGRFEEWRRACHADHRAFGEMVRRERLTLATDRLRYFAHWITPEERPLRFDTRFFAGPMPPAQDAVADGKEIVAVRWLTPAEALAARERGEISLRLPTIRNLEQFVTAPSVSEALAGVGEGAVPTIRPRLISEGGVMRSLLPGDRGWY